MSDHSHYFNWESPKEYFPSPLFYDFLLIFILVCVQNSRMPTVDNKGGFKYIQYRSFTCVPLVRLENSYFKWKITINKKHFLLSSY